MTWIHIILQSIAALLISPTVPVSTSTVWQGALTWKTEGEVLVYSAASTEIIRECRIHPDDYVITPILTQGGHEFFLDGKKIFSSADRSFKKTSNFYNTAALPCNLIAEGSILRWEAFTQTHTLAKLRAFPTVGKKTFLSFFLRDTANTVFPGTLMGLSFLCMLIFFGKVENKLIFSLVMMCVSSSITFILFVPEDFQISMPQTLLQSISDVCLWIALIATGHLYFYLGYTSKKTLNLLIILCTIGIAIIVLAENLDQNQIGGTSLYSVEI